MSETEKRLSNQVWRKEMQTLSIPRQHIKKGLKIFKLLSVNWPYLTIGLRISKSVTLLYIQVLFFEKKFKKIAISRKLKGFDQSKLEGNFAMPMGN